MIGKGGSSQVYKGCLPGSWEIAVKILKPSNYVLEHFASEIEILTSFRHKNIISLVGFCYNEDQLLLVYNLLSRGCLEENLHGIYMFIFLELLLLLLPHMVLNTCFGLGCPVSRDQFGWGKRYKIALGVAEALDALHNAAEPIIHRDVKSSNILLSDDFEPQVPHNISLFPVLQFIFCALFIATMLIPLTAIGFWACHMEIEVFS